MDAFPKGINGHDDAGRLWDIHWVLRYAMKQAQPGQSQISFDLLGRNDNLGPSLAITIMLPGEA